MKKIVIKRSVGGFDGEEGIYFLGYMEGYTKDFEEAYRYTKQEIVEFQEQDKWWRLDKCQFILVDR